jgi:hypothetical protein
MSWACATLTRVCDDSTMHMHAVCEHGADADCTITVWLTLDNYRPSSVVPTADVAACQPCFQNSNFLCAGLAGRNLPLCWIGRP